MLRYFSVHSASGKSWRVTYWLIDRLIDQSINWLKILLIDAFNKWLISWLIDWLIDCIGWFEWLLYLEIPVLLVGEGLDGAGVDGAGHVLLGQGYRVLRHHSLARRGVGRHEDTLGSLGQRETKKTAFRDGHGLTSIASTPPINTIANLWR